MRLRMKHWGTRHWATGTETLKNWDTGTGKLVHWDTGILGPCPNTGKLRILGHMDWDSVTTDTVIKWNN